jgi:hypothetical protein
MSNVNQEMLCGVALETRAQLESKSWPNSYIRPSCAGKPLSYGQCQDSIWHLLRGLRVNGLDGIRQPIQRHMGRLAFDTRHNLPSIYPHQWLTVAAFTLEITGDQEGANFARVTCATAEELAELGMIYEPYLTFNVWLEGDRWDEAPIITSDATQPVLTQAKYHAEK